jgi:hypothetical protein
MKRTATGWLNMTSPDPGGWGNQLDQVVHQTGTLTGMWALGTYSVSRGDDPIPLLLYHP